MVSDPERSSELLIDLDFGFVYVVPMLTYRQKRCSFCVLCEVVLLWNCKVRDRYAIVRAVKVLSAKGSKRFVVVVSKAWEASYYMHSTMAC